MTTTSVGYDGTVDEVAWASLSQLLGSSYNVLTGLSVTVGGTGPSGTDRAITIAAGTAFGRGVIDTFSTATVLNATSVGSGSRWDTLVVRRNWSTNTSTLAIQTGSATKAIAAGLNATPGVLDDQPLYLLQVTAGQTAVQALEDLRAPGGKTLLTAGAPTLARPNPNLGSNAIDLSTGHRWVAKTVAGVITWVDLDDTGAWRPINLPSSVLADGTAPSYKKVSGVTFLRGAWQKADGSVFAPGGGTNGSYSLGTIDAGYRPGSNVSFVVDHAFDTTSTSVRVTITTGGVITGTAGPVYSGTSGATSRIRADGISYPAEN